MTGETAVLERAGRHKSKGLSMLNADDFLLMASRRYVAFDLETTGLNPRSDMITEIGALRVEYGKVTATFQQLVNPRCPIPREVTSLTHITNEMVASAPGIEEVLPAFLDFIGDDAFVAHNAPFDAGFLQTQCRRLGLTLKDNCADSLEVARKIWPGLSTYRLGHMAQIIGFEMRTAHRSLADTEALAALVNAAVRNDRVHIRTNPLYTPGWDLPRERYPEPLQDGMDRGRLAVARAVYYMEQQFGTGRPYSREELSAVPCRHVAQFPGVNNLYELTAVIRECWSRETIYDAVWDCVSPAFHQDDVTACLVRDMCSMNDAAVETVYIETERGRHVFNRLGGKLIDLTGGLDGEPEMQEGMSVETCLFNKESPNYPRYRQLQQNLKNLLCG